jgi:aminopeptidase N
VPLISKSIGVLFFVVSFIFPHALIAQNEKALPLFTQQDTLRGTLNENRTWWNVVQYQITIEPQFKTKSISGSTTILFKTVAAGQTMQIDLQAPLQIDSVFFIPTTFEGSAIAMLDSSYHANGNAWLFRLPYRLPLGTSGAIKIVYHGLPKEAVDPPWEGGWIWKQDLQHNPWMSVACQSLGASVWYPCKDHQSDEPDSGALLKIVVPDTLCGIGNGRLNEKINNHNGTITWCWAIKNPINNYNIVPYIGKYENFTEIYKGEKGNLDCSYWVLAYHLAKAKQQFKQVTSMLSCFEKWFGPYPFYEDGYKLVEAPYLGMEHQSAIAYGNNFQNGYLGKDLSVSGWGLKWDFIIVHESGHEWFGNNITTNDVADMWVHEGFTSYAESIYTQERWGVTAGNAYVLGTQAMIVNDKPIIGPYGVNKEGSGDMYCKAANMLHTIRQVINNDEKFKQLLRSINKTFYHQTVTSKQIEDYINQYTGIDFSSVFDQYLKTTQVPVLEYQVINKKNIRFRFINCIPTFSLPIKINLTKPVWIKPSTQWQTLRLLPKDTSKFRVDPNFYIGGKELQ